MTKPIAIISEPKAVSFWNISRQITKVLKKEGLEAKLYPWTSHKITEPNIIFMGNLFQDTAKHMIRFKPDKNVVFYGVTEGVPLLDQTSLQVLEDVKVITPSLYAKECLKQANIKVTDIIPHGIDLTLKPDQLFKEKMKQFLPPPSNVQPSNVMFCISGNVQRKGIDKLLVAYKTIQHIVKDSYLILHSGTGDINISVMQQAIDLQRFLWTNSWGMLSPDKVASLYKLADYYVQPSMSEGFGLTYLEAFQWDLPVIGVNCPATAEIVKDGYTGILLPVTRTEDIVWQQHHAIRLYHYTIDALIDAILCLTNENIRINMSVNAKKEKQKWDMQEIYKRFIKYMD
jgi:glycosyltransferase involved in cell wall biosynthesis